MNNVLCIIALGAFMMGTLSAYDHPREGTEWTRTYVYNANDNKLPRVLLVGDSICNGYNELARDELAGTAYVSFWATSKCATDRSYLKELAFILGDYDYSIVHFNNGLHSLNTPPEEWEKAMREAYAMIRSVKPKAKIIWCSSTPLKDPALTEKAKVLNEIGRKLAAEFGVPTDDLFALMDPMDRAQYWTDTYHYNNDAKKMQAKQVAGSVRAVLGGQTATTEEAAAALARAASDTGPDGKLSTVSSSLVRNGSFDTGNDWSIYPPGKTDVVTSEYGNEEGSTGRCAKIVNRKAGSQFYQQKPALSAGGKYLLTFRAKADGALKLQVHVRPQKPPYVYYGDKTIELGTVWSEYSAVIETPADYQPGDHLLFFNLLSAGTYWIDDVRIIRQ